MKSIFKRASFWNLVVQSFQIALGSVQGISLSVEKDIQNFNIIIAFGQAALGILSLWTRDTNQNDVIDIAEGTVTTTVTVTAPKSADVTIDKTTETKEP